MISGGSVNVLSHWYLFSIKLFAICTFSNYTFVKHNSDLYLNYSKFSLGGIEYSKCLIILFRYSFIPPPRFLLLVRNVLTFSPVKCSLFLVKDISGYDMAIQFCVFDCFVLVFLWSYFNIIFALTCHYCIWAPYWTLINFHKNKYLFKYFAFSW